LNNSILQTTLDNLDIPAFIQRADTATLARMIASQQTEDTEQPSPEKLPRFGLVYEKQGIGLFKRFIAMQEGIKRENIYSCFQSAYTCWRSLALLPDEPQQAINGHISTAGVHFIEMELYDELLSPILTLAFRLSVSGLLGGRTAETRLDLARFQLSPQHDFSDNWRNVVTENIFSAFVLLVRKADGWSDIQLALQNIVTLRRMQQTYEEKYLEEMGDPEQQSSAALELVGLYNLAQLITLVAEYLQDGRSGYEKVCSRLDRHYEQAVDALEVGQHLLLAHLADLLWAGCRELVQNAIWTHVALLGQRVQDYVLLLTSSDRSKPVIELWPSQQEALQRHLLDPYQRAILVEMPTSAGKTLLAKFTIIQTKALNPDGLIAYVVPTRALVNQVTLDFRTDLGSLLHVEQTVPVFELDPTEAKLLQGNIDILVTTPEKLDLLVRSDHPSVKNISLVVADEAHNISDGERGARLELLLGTIKRDFARARFLLLSPFLPNPEDLVQWLGEQQAMPPIKVDWKPNRKLVGSVQSNKKHNEWLLEFEALASIHSIDVQTGSKKIDVRSDMKIPIGLSSSRLTTIKALSKATAEALIRRGTVLILCWGPADATERATEIANDRLRIKSDEKLEAICHYIDAELGHGSPLVSCLRHGVAYHHSGLSQETRWLIEELIRDRLVDVVCGTTTLAQGVNFPITTVIIETFRKGRSGKLSFQDFWNIAGRAGRTLVDSIGIVAFPTPTPAKREEFTNFLKNEAEEVVSQLTQLIERVDRIGMQFNLQALRNNPQLSPLLQFLAHAMRVSGKDNLADEVEDLLRASLVYHQTQKTDHDAALKLIKICRAYLEQTREHKNILGLADQTGFATPSVRSLLAQRDHNRELAYDANWMPDNLFGRDLEPLTERVNIIADIPEISLGQDERGAFNARRVAAILRDWVNGKTIEEMARSYGSANNDQNKQITDFSKYLFSMLSRASWGMGALETVCLSGNERTNWNQVGYIPSMIFFGVPQKEAIWLRMVGVPRIVAGGLADLWKQRFSSEPESYDGIRNWVANLTDSEWKHALPTGTALTPNDMRLIWQSFSGGR
jgi:replicative superfamily II helicase